MYKLYFSDNAGASFTLPRAPEEITIICALDVDEDALCSGVKVIASADVELRVVTFTAQFYTEDQPSPQQYVNQLRQWQMDGTALRFIYIADGRDISMPVVVDNIEHREQGGAVGDIDCDITLRESRRPVIQRLTLCDSGSEAALTSSSREGDTRSTPSTYTLVAGDCLWTIAQRFYGDSSKYKDIQQLNGIADSQLRKLPVGLVIQLP